MPYSEDDLALAVRHVADGEERIARLRKMITRSRAQGQPTALPELLLRNFLETLEAMREHLRIIEADLHKSASDSRP